ncbi:MAG TPA: Nramp family divalent metal transporter [Lacipirellula sp.]
MTAKRDPYVLDGSLIADPPSSLWGRLKLLGPGLVLTASIVGSGELIATTTLGAQAGFAALWIILISCVVKVAVQLQFGRHTIQTGETCLTAFNHLPGPAPRGVNWATWAWLLIQPAKMLQVGGIIGTTALLMNTMVPQLSVGSWAIVTAVIIAALVSGEGYRFIESMCVVLVGAFTVTTLIAVASLQWTDYAVSGTDLAEGLRFTLPVGGLLAAMGAFGLTGVGGDEIMHYTYWLIEKGYAAKTGPRIPGDAQWERRAKEWIKVMYLDAFVSMLVYTIVTAAFYLLGAAVLHARGEVPGADEIVPTLSNMYTESLGDWARGVFLAGAFVVLFSTLFSALAAWTRMVSDICGQLRVIDFADPAARRRTVNISAWVIPLIWAAVFQWHGEPVNMVLLGGIGTALILLISVAASIHFRYGRTAPELQPGLLYDAALWISIASIIAVAGYTVFKTVGELTAA